MMWIHLMDVAKKGMTGQSVMLDCPNLELPMYIHLDF